MSVQGTPRSPGASGGQSSPRAVAAKVLLRVERDGAFAAAALSSALESDKNLAARDRGLCTELVYGVLRVRDGLTVELSRLLHRGGVAKLDAEVRTQLLLGLYQLLYLDRVPAFAVTHEAVSLVRRARGDKMAGFTNAILRRAIREIVPDAGARARIAQASVPAWLASALTDSLGEAGARAFLDDALRPPPSALTVVDPAARDGWLATVRESWPDAEASPFSSRGIRVPGGIGHGKLPGVDQALFVQEEGSQIIAQALAVRPGERVLDTCAGRGQKTAILAADLGAAGGLTATDLHDAKLSELESRFVALGLPVPERFAVDWSRGAGEARGPFDAILVDAPCTGIGTLRRRPDLLQRRQPADLQRLPDLQAAILEQASLVLKPGGRLVYAVCSVLREEAEQVVERVLAKGVLEPCAFASAEVQAMAEAVAPGAHASRLLPSAHTTDGYFLASLRRR